MDDDAVMEGEERGEGRGILGVIIEKLRYDG